MPAAVITGASQGLGLATARALAGRGWSLIVDARHAAQLTSAVGGLATVTAIPGDVTDPAHRAAIAASVAPAGRLDLLMNNASRLGPVRCRRCAATRWTSSRTSTRPTCWRPWP